MSQEGNKEGGWLTISSKWEMKFPDGHKNIFRYLPAWWGRQGYKCKSTINVPGCFHSINIYTLIFIVNISVSCFISQYATIATVNTEIQEDKPQITEHLIKLNGIN